jgi:putative colanic acid biosynthesis acetyltransferase WcaF
MKEYNKQAFTDLSLYDNSWYNPGRGPIVRALWFIVNALFFINALNPSSQLKVFLLKLFGARLGQGVVIKPGVNIKYPWHLKIGDYTWIGEKVWIDCLGSVNIGKSCCISQGAMLLNGNHDYSHHGFGLKVQPIELKDGVWIGARSLVAPGVTCGSHAVLSVMSVASTNLESYSVYRGNPAVKVKDRVIV